MSQQTPAQLQEHTERIDQAIRVLVWWLVEAQTGFTAKDARGIEDILDHGSVDAERGAS